MELFRNINEVESKYHEKNYYYLSNFQTSAEINWLTL
jgi:hypothetical protein